MKVHKRCLCDKVRGNRIAIEVLNGSFFLNVRHSLYPIPSQVIDARLPSLFSSGAFVCRMRRRRERYCFRPITALRQRRRGAVRVGLVATLINDA